jgi:hypothetical protein
VTGAIEDQLHLRMGAGHDLQILIIPPLFEELNRTRRMIAEMMRGLDQVGIGSRLIDLPGTAEDMLESCAITLTLWRNAVRAAAGTLNPVVIASLRGGALVDEAGTAKGWWRFAPETGARTVRDLERARLASANGTALYAGHALSEAFVSELRAALPNVVTPLRTVRLESDAADAEVKLPGTPLWRRAEPGEDATMSASLAANLAEWTKQCAAR